MKNPKEIGQVLKEARGKKNLTAEKIYKATRIQPHIIEALEEGRADGVLSRVYVLLFLKKYASFLDLDGENLAAAYRAFYAREEEAALASKKHAPETAADLGKWVVPLMAGILALAVALSILVLGARLRGRSAPPRQKRAAAGGKEERIFPIPADKHIALDLRSTADVWMKVKKDGKVVFEGILRKGDTKKWVAADEMELWVGKAEALLFTVNDKPIGKIGEGRIKSIRITREGLKAAKKWIIRAAENRFPSP